MWFSENIAQVFFVVLGSLVVLFILFLAVSDFMCRHASRKERKEAQRMLWTNVQGLFFQPQLGSRSVDLAVEYMRAFSIVGPNHDARMREEWKKVSAVAVEESIAQVMCQGELVWETKKDFIQLPPEVESSCRLPGSEVSVWLAREMERDRFHLGRPSIRALYRIEGRHILVFFGDLSDNQTTGESPISAKHATWATCSSGQFSAEEKAAAGLGQGG
jgi:hypothetical protein